VVNQLVTELTPSRDGLIRSVVLQTPNGNLINQAIQCLYPLEVYQDHEDIFAKDAAGTELVDDPAPPDPAPMTPDPVSNDPDLAIGEVEPDDTGSGGEYVGNVLTPQQPISRSGRRSRLPRHLNDY
jgi:hypothetical protein